MTSDERHSKEEIPVPQEFHTPSELNEAVKNLVAGNYCFLYLKKGRVALQTCNYCFIMQKKDLALIPPGFDLEIIKRDTNILCYMLAFNVTTDGDLSSTLRDNLKKTFISDDAVHFCAVSPDSKVIRLLFTTLLTIQELKNHAESDVVLSTIDLLVSQFKEYYSQSEEETSSFVQVKEKLIKRFFDLLQECFRQWHSVTYYAGELCVTRGHLTRVLREAGHRSPKQYIISILLKESESLLGSTDLSIASIAETLGFDSPTSFSIFFKKNAGISASEHREQLLKSKKK